MKKPSANSKTFWQNDIVLETTTQRKKVEYLLNKMKIENSKFSVKFYRFLKKVF